VFLRPQSLPTVVVVVVVVVRVCWTYEPVFFSDLRPPGPDSRSGYDLRRAVVAWAKMTVPTSPVRTHHRLKKK
jgi:hypothetical protein